MTAASKFRPERPERLRRTLPIHLEDLSMMNAKRTAIVLAGALGLPVLTALPAAAAPAAPDNVSIDVVSVNGSGCPAGTSSVVISDDKTAFTVFYSDFLASAGGNAPPTAFRKNCQISLRV